MMYTLKTEEELSSLLQKSIVQSILIFKHSNTCPVSAVAYKKISIGIDRGELKIPVHMLIVQESRSLSNFIAEKFDSTHESPQVILVRNQKAYWTESHRKIDVSSINNSIQDV
ncbi:MAG: bacillithiol system redox-active protein YtxJ [Candidatus Pacebacteria bacterium]|nr:bacillithiol system redox-active protein YtxJ [Candidatus Paceibacterota bacterium]